MFFWDKQLSGQKCEKKNEKNNNNKIISFRFFPLYFHQTMILKVIIGTYEELKKVPIKEQQKTLKCSKRNMHFF